MVDTPPTRLPAWDPTTKPATVWAELINSARTDEDRACLAAATSQAYRVWVALHSGRLGAPSTDPGIPARNQSWYRIALSGLEILRESGAYRHLAYRGARACAAAEPILEFWLNSHVSTPAGPDALTLAQRLGVGEAVHAINGDTQVAHLSTVLRAAQDAAMFGLPGHRVDLAVAAAAPGDTATMVRVVIDTTSGPALASQPLRLAQLVDPDAAGPAGTIAALRRIADVANTLFKQYAAAVWQSPPPRPERSEAPSGHPFPALAPAEHVEPPASPPPNAPRAGRAR